MAKFVSRRNPVSVASLKRKATGSVVARHYVRVDIKFTRTNGGWLRERQDATERPEVVTSADVAAECNHAFGCADSWARVY